MSPFGATPETGHQTNFVEQILLSFKRFEINIKSNVISNKIIPETNVCV